MTRYSRPVALARRVDRDHVRMVDRRGHPRLALEALAERPVARPIGRQQLEGDGPAEAQLGGAIDHAHAAAAGHRFDAAAGELVAWFELGHPEIVTRVRCTSRHGSRQSQSPISSSRAGRRRDVLRRPQGRHRGARPRRSRGRRLRRRDRRHARRSGRPPVRRRLPGRGDLRARRRPHASTAARPSSSRSRRRTRPRWTADPDDVTPDGLNDKLKRAWDYLSGHTRPASAGPAARARGRRRGCRTPRAPRRR